MKILLVALALCTLSFWGCTQHKVETKSEIALAPVEIKPIHITIDVNIRVDKALDDFFKDLD